MTIADDFPTGYVTVVKYDSWHTLCAARGYVIHFTNEGRVAMNDFEEFVGEWNGETSEGWVE